MAGSWAVTSPAEAAPLASARTATANSSAVVQIRDYRDDDYDYGRRYHRRYRERTYVRAPFTRVETRGYRATAVDAPFASVRVGRRGTWVRAPFVDLFVPRD
jgi:hypothetical protein